MPVSNSVIRRYTPPTCTLEVLAQNSALSRWMGKSVLKQLRFELRFDDPRLPEEQRITIRGDHDQLDALHTTVTNYVQELLEKSPEDFWLSFSAPIESDKTFDAFESKSLDDSSNIETKIPNSFSTQTLGTEIQLEPSEHLTHKLLLGSLANQASASVVQLSLLQLFDLATALDEYSADVLLLPNLNPERSASGFPTWAPVAAVLVLAAGLTPLTWQYGQSLRQKQQTAKKPTLSQPEKVALAPSPSLNAPAPSPLLTPPDTLLSQSQTPLALLGSPVPPPPPVSSSSNFPTTSLKTPKSNLPPASQTFPNITFPKTATSSSSGLLTIPGSTTQFSPLKKTAPLSRQEKPQIAFQPNLRDNTTGLASKNGTTLPQSGISSSTLATKNSAYPSGSLVSPPSLGVIPDNSSTRGRRNSINLPSEPSLTTDNSLISNLRTNRKTATSIATGALFDTAQVAEARDYLKKHWQPPAALKQTIQYSLLVGVDGTIEQIMPLGKAARDFVDRSGMPLIGEHFVSPNKNGQAVRIRAVLSPDGKVQTFPEAE